MLYPILATESNWVGVDGQTGLCLDSDGNTYTDSCNGGNSQNWKFDLNTIVDVQTGLCLDGDVYGSVSTNTCNGNNTSDSTAHVPSHWRHRQEMQ
jgi:hypothetical protein